MTRGDAFESMTFYQLLDVNPDASHAEIRRAYRRRAQHVHPDKSGQEDAGFIELTKAFDVLSDPGRRRAYDESLARGTPRAAPRFDPFAIDLGPVVAGEPVSPSTVRLLGEADGVDRVEIPTSAGTFWAASAQYAPDGDQILEVILDFDIPVTAEHGPRLEHLTAVVGDQAATLELRIDIRPAVRTADLVPVSSPTSLPTERPHKSIEPAYRPTATTPAPGRGGIGGKVAGAVALVVLVLIGYLGFSNEKRDDPSGTPPIGVRPLWTANIPIQDPSGSTGLISAADVLLLRHGTGSWVALDRRNGRIRWRAQIAMPVRHVVGSTVLLGGEQSLGDNRLVALDAATGKVLWRRAGLPADTTAVSGSQVIVVGAVASYFAIGLRTGKITWRRNIRYGFDRGLVPASGGYVLAYGDDGLLGYDRRGRVAWRRSDQFARSLAGGGSTPDLLTDGLYVTRINPRNGKAIWSHRLPPGAWTSHDIHQFGAMVYLSNGHGLAYDIRTGRTKFNRDVTTFALIADPLLCGRGPMRPGNGVDDKYAVDVLLLNGRSASLPATASGAYSPNLVNGDLIGCDSARAFLARHETSVYTVTAWRV